MKRLQPGKSWVPKPLPKTEDFVIAIPGHRDQELVFAAGRQSRRGVQTYMATSYQPSGKDLYPSSANETWGWYPDDNPKRSWYPGDSRAALTPFLAYNALRQQNFSWLLYGDDDTVFFLDAAKEVVKDLDPEQPYFLTDNLWWGDMPDNGYHPHPNAPHCNAACPPPSNLTAANPFASEQPCPCTPEAMCTRAGFRKWNIKGCDPPDSYAMHGGAGGLFSIGLLRSINPAKMEDCVLRQQDSGGDAFLTACLWEQEVAPTWPDSTHPRGLPSLDPSPGPLHPDDFITDKAAYLLANLLLDAAGACSGLCKLELQRTVSIHLRARRIGGSMQGTAAFIRLFSRLAAGSSDGKPKQADVMDKVSASLAKQADAAVKEGVAALNHLLLALKGTDKPPKAGTLDIRREAVAPILLKDSILTAAAKTVADHVLNQLLHAVEPLSNQKGFDGDTCAAGIKRAWDLNG